MRVGVESTLTADQRVALCAGVAVRLAGRGVRQVGGLADRAQFAAGHGCDLGHRVR